MSVDLWIRFGGEIKTRNRRKLMDKANFSGLECSIFVPKHEQKAMRDGGDAPWGFMGRCRESGKMKG
jgi:hypothetical protein